MSTEFTHWLVEQMQVIGPVTARRMFGGQGLFIDGLMFAIIFDDQLYLKADDHNCQAFLDQGFEPFTYMRQGKRCALSYYQAPDELLGESLESLELMRLWGNEAFGAALRSRR
ncbi:TfoX/Sxy family protein [Marinobacterium lutimaris]|uniref:DNA transformation protein n=1 Tax=Marinobacterium lutimaris TaxID=568106 RepID=A0A1H5YYA5_9GAMM|nr:TfoX/Sxy family protein [Marinobacterium lutimaris]SEG29041.1 DNA transformation protein [Marinobacterium lutimaris]